MNSKDRVLCTLKHKEPDRVPFDLSSTGATEISLIAKEFAQTGAVVAIFSRNINSVEKAKEELYTLGFSMIFGMPVNIIDIEDFILLWQRQPDSRNF